MYVVGFTSVHVIIMEMASHFSQKILTITYLLPHLKDVHFVYNWNEPVCIQLYTWLAFICVTYVAIGSTVT